MKKFNFFKSALFLAAIPLGINAQKMEKLNVLYIMSDDHAAEAIGAYGGRLARLNVTPVLDKLASEGILFTNCFVTNSISTPSRACILTGQYSQTNGVLDLGDSLAMNRHYLPLEMKKLGYQTAIIGKWHLVNEPNFDYYNVLPGQGAYFNPVFITKGGKPWSANKTKYPGHVTDVITDLSINWLNNRDKRKPFFLMLHNKAPHDNFNYDTKYENYLSDVDIPEPVSMYFRDGWGSEATKGLKDSLIHVIGSSVSSRNIFRNYVEWYKVDKTASPDFNTHLAYQVYLKRYLRCVKGIDDNLERLFNYLKENGMWENTIIIYTSDQGMMLGEHDLIDKRWMYEESIRMPFIIYSPGISSSGRKSSLLINNTDFAPTILELAGGFVPSYMQGRSFASELKGKRPENWRTATYYRYWMHMEHLDVPSHFGIRTEDYKLIFFYGYHYKKGKMGSIVQRSLNISSEIIQTPAAWEFYDVRRDPEELVNRYNDPMYATIIADLKEEILRQRNQLNETDEKYPVINEIITRNWDKK